MDLVNDQVLPHVRTRAHFCRPGYAQQQQLGLEEELTAEDVEESTRTLEKPMHTPFVELYLLEETKALRQEMQNTWAELIEKVVDKELSVADKPCPTPPTR